MMNGGKKNANMKKQTRFSEVVSEARSGAIDHDLSEKLAEIVRAVREHGGKGNITLKVAIAQNDAGSVKLDFNISTKRPEPALGTALMFADDSGNLTRNDTRQLSMFRDPSAPTIESRVMSPEEVAANA
jgi:hypothetical protein